MTVELDARPAPPQPQPAPRRPFLSWLRNPWGRPRVLPIVTAIYILWSILPV